MGFCKTDEFFVITFQPVRLDCSHSLVTRRGVNLCVPIDEAWVRSVLVHVDWVRSHCKKVGYKVPDLLFHT